MKTKRALAERMTNQTQVHEHNQYAMICVTMNKRLLAEMHKRAAAMQVSIGELAVRMMERCVLQGHTPGPWEIRRDYYYPANRNLIAAAPELLEACKTAEKLIRVARNYFPKSMQNSDRFDLENACAAICKAIAKAEGKA